MYSDDESSSPKELSSVREQQIQRLCTCLFPGYMQLTEQEFAAQVPVLGPNVLNSLKEGENLLLVIPENLIEPIEQMRLASIRMLIDLLDKKEDRTYPSDPYWIRWRLLGSETTGSGECIYDPHPPARSLSIIEGVHLAIQYPRLLQNLALALSSTSLPKGHTGILCHWRGRPQISTICRAAANRYAAMGGQLIIVRELPEEGV